MKHNIPLNTLPMTASEPIKARRFVQVALAGLAYAADGGLSIGISGPLDTEKGQIVDVVTAGFMPVEFETAAKPGDPVGVGTDGKAKVVAASEARCIALQDVAAGEVGSVAVRI